MNAPDQIPLPIESNFMATSLSVPATRKPRASKEKAVAITEKYEPIASVWHGEDAELLERMLDFYPRTRPKRILDATVNRGRFWRDSERPVTGLDIDPACRPDILAD